MKRRRARRAPSARALRSAARSPAAARGPARAAPPKAVGIDTGGTFTDLVAIVGGRLLAFKVPSTPAAPDRAVLEALARARVTRETRVRHGSTVATNALLERKGASVAFFTSAGFEDLLEIGRQDRLDIYALHTKRTEPLVPAQRRLGVAERLDAHGRVLVALGAGDTAKAVQRAKRMKTRVAAVGFLHAYANPVHERKLARALRAAGIQVCASHEICPEMREYERFATTVANAYLLPRVSGYLERIAKGTPAEIEVMLSHGGTAPPARAAREPVRQLLSGPAAGLAAAREVARRAGFDRALTIDVGGTSTDCAFIAGGLPRRRAREVAGFPIQLPMLDVHTVGAGGGSIASVDAGGLLRVGPESAGADPGPACYGRGGPATMTDALVVLGRITGDALAGGALAIDRATAERALARLARALGLPDARAAAAGVVAIGEAHMEAALRKVSVERGEDPRDAALVAFGGAGGLHACALAEALGVRAVLAPRHAGVLSALGALMGGARRERSRSVMLDAANGAALERAWRALAREVLAEFPRGGRARVRLERVAEMRYRGQAHELSIGGGARLVERFHEAHRRRYGFDARDREVVVVTIEVRGALPGERLPANRGGGAAPRVNARVVEREALAAGARVRGPAIVAESGATLWVPSGWAGKVHAGGTLVLARGRS